MIKGLKFNLVLVLMLPEYHVMEETSSIYLAKTHILGMFLQNKLFGEFKTNQ